MGVWLCVSFYPMNVKTAELIGPKFCVGPHMTPGKVYGWSKFQKLFYTNLIFIKFWKYNNFFYNIRKLYCFCFKTYKKRKCSIEIEDAGSESLLRVKIMKILSFLYLKICFVPAAYIQKVYLSIYIYINDNLNNWIMSIYIFLI